MSDPDDQSVIRRYLAGQPLSDAELEFIAGCGHPDVVRLQLVLGKATPPLLRLNALVQQLGYVTTPAMNVTRAHLVAALRAGYPSVAGLWTEYIQATDELTDTFDDDRGRLAAAIDITHIWFEAGDVVEWLRGLRDILRIANDAYPVVAETVSSLLGPYRASCVDRHAYEGYALAIERYQQLDQAPLEAYLHGLLNFYLTRCLLEYLEAPFSDFDPKVAAPLIQATVTSALKNLRDYPEFGRVSALLPEVAWLGIFQS